MPEHEFDNLSYWNQVLSGLVSLDLPTDNERNNVSNHNRAIYNFTINKFTAQGLLTLTGENNTTVLATFLTAFKILLYRYSGQADLCVSTISNINLLPLRTSLEGKCSFTELLQKVHTTFEMALENSGSLSRDLNTSDENSSDTRLEIINQFILYLGPDTLLDDDLSAHKNLISQALVDNEFLIQLIPYGSELKGSIEYSPGLYNERTISRMIGNFIVLLNSVIDHPEECIDTLKLLSGKEEHDLLVAFNNTKSYYNPEKTVIDLFEEQVSKSPDAIAIVFGDIQITYKSLNEQANKLANHLIAKGLMAGALVPICMERSPEMIAGLLGILKAGATYVPIDPKYPEERIRYMLKDIDAAIVLGNRKYNISIVEQASLIDISEDWHEILKQPSTNLKTVIKPEHLAYVIYTSGSTGKPKGAGVYHKSIVNLLQWYIKEFKISDKDNVLIISSFAFDLTQKNIFSPLVSGGKIVLPEMELYDNNLIVDCIQSNEVTFINCAPNAFYPIVEYPQALPKIQSLRLAILGGEPIHLSRLEKWILSDAFNCEIVNSYGPTECTDIASFYRIKSPKDYLNKIIPIGRPNDNVRLYVLNGALQIQPINVAGELYIAGDGVGAGYIKDAQLTSDKFIPDPFGTEEGARLYKTGDWACRLPDGNVDYLGRIDHQVKVRGYRIELGEIESALQTCNFVKQCVVIAKADATGNNTLIAYIVSDSVFNKPAITEYLQSKLPDYMIPTVLIELMEIPLTGNGKVDRAALPNPFHHRLTDALYVAPKNKTELNIAEIWKEVLSTDKIGVNDNFFECGGNSLNAVRIVAAMNEAHQYQLPVIKLYQYPTIKGLAEYFDGSKKNVFKTDTRSKPTLAVADIAIIGMAGRFPGAETIDELWDILKDGRETISFFSDEELDSSIPDHLRNDPDYIKARGVIKNAQYFDAAFFGLNPKLAEVMDPQQRVFLEIAWEVLESSGYLPQHYSGSIGVYAGCGNNTYYLNNVLKNEKILSQVGEFRAMTVNEKDYISSRTSYQLNLKGPSVSVYSACSTSLLAITQAVDAIRNGHCDVAIAGGSSITSPINSGHLYQEGSMMSSDGHCRSFDADAKGTMFSDGAGVVLLKSLQEAIRDGDKIYSVIKGIGVNNDGSDKGSFTGPSTEGQAYAISKAIDDAGIEPSSITYIEAHGTATPIGDPIEIEGLKIAFGDQVTNQYCAIGSIKSNMGHLTAAAGVAGLIKATLALNHKKIPASTGYKTPNPHIDFANSPFYVNSTLADWSSNGLRRAGVSSFGIGGTNVHVILEEHPEENVPEQISEPSFQLVTWSAKSEKSLSAYAENLAAYIAQYPEINVSDIAYTLQTTRAPFNCRAFTIAESSDNLKTALKNTGQPFEIKTLTETPQEIVFMFPGQGSQYVNMGRDLYESETAFRKAVDECAELLLPHLVLDIRQVIYPETNDSAAADVLINTKFTQPALFVIEYALAKLWMSWGIEPSILCGHSIGEFVAAHFAGVFNLADGLKLIATRGRMVSELPQGQMLSVRMDSEALNTILPDNLSLAAINSDKLCVVAGEEQAISDFSRVLDEKDIAYSLLHTSHAFHSKMMDPIVDEFKTVVSETVLSFPKKPLMSTVTGTWLSDSQATDPDYWAQHLRLTVRFADAVKCILENENVLFLEAGPGNVTSILVRQQMGLAKAVAVASLEKNSAHTSETQSVLKALGQLYINGVEPDWQSFYEGQIRKKIHLPTYAFDRKYCWVEPVETIVSKPLSIRDEITYQKTVELKKLLEYPGSEVPQNNHLMKNEILIQRVKEIIEETSGLEIADLKPNLNFLKIGLDSLLLTQVASTFKKKFNLPFTFRQLLEDTCTIELVAAYIEKNSDPAAMPDLQVEAPQHTITQHTPTFQPQFNPASNGNIALDLIAQQLQILAKQVTLLQTGNAPVSLNPTGQSYQHSAEKIVVNHSSTNELTPEEAIEIKKPFGATAHIDRQVTELTSKQYTFLTELTLSYNRKTEKSKKYAQEHRSYMADPRVVSGFKPLTKEIVYPIVINRSKGSRLWDLDGNEYIDILNGFGSNMFGYQPEVLTNALHDQVEKGFEVGPQHELAGEVSKLICEFTGFDRAALCSTGSEAVLGAMRIARTITGKSLIVAFTGSYHGIVDEVLVRGTKKLRSFPAASGIMPEAVQNMLILDYGTEESFQIIKSRANELAAVLVEPVQSRRPEFAPVEFLKKVREVTTQASVALIFDEVITGFRMHPGGAQALFGIKADIATYGKVVGGGLPIGVIAGKKQFMDALDGGFWRYGDTTFPEVGVTYFAGTFVRHPLTLASARAALQYMKDRGPALQKELNEKGEEIASKLNVEFKKRQLPFYVAQFGSLWKIKFHEDVPYKELLFTLMRQKGVHVCDGFPCFMTEAHTKEEINLVIKLFIESADEMIAAGFFKQLSDSETSVLNFHNDLNSPPVSGARLGRDKNGNPAWFIANPDNPGNYLQVAAK
jgi:amino acid adenylation domain-containing protein